MSFLASQGLSSLTQLQRRNAATTQINWLVTAVNYARHAAITHRITVTLCPAAMTGRGCNGRWHDDLIAFLDHNQDARINGKDKIINSIPSTAARGTLIWRAFRNRQYLQFTEHGYTRYQNGNFVYCPQNQNLRYARQIVINVQGRARINHRKNPAGLTVDRKGKLLRC
jgi:type IV fimbrial biogenesis protein FimT